jgi:hypothetical protein
MEPAAVPGGAAAGAVVSYRGETTEEHVTGRRATAAVAALAAVLLLAVAAPQARAAGSGSAQVYVVQGIAGERLDVFVDDRAVRRGVEARTVVGPVEVPPGRHVLSLRSGDDVAAEATFEAAAGGSTDLVAHRFPDASREPSVTVLRNDVSAVPQGRTRLRIVHTAVVGPADIVVDDAVLVSNLANGESATEVVAAGTYRVAVVPTATTGPAVLGPVDLEVSAGTLTTVYAIGDPAAGTMDAVVHVLPAGSTGSGAPDRVDTGDGGQAVRDGGPAPGSAFAAGGLVGVLGLAGLAGLRGRRDRSARRWAHSIR